MYGGVKGVSPSFRALTRDCVAYHTRMLERLLRATRRQFLASAGAATTAARAEVFPPDLRSSIDFRYAPFEWQSCISFTDYDSHKTLVSENGALRYGHPETSETV